MLKGSIGKGLKLGCRGGQKLADLGFRLRGLGFRVQGSGFRV